MFKPLNQYNAFFALAPERTLCGLDQLVGLHIQNKFNQSHWAETIQIEDAELLKLICWYDKTGTPTTIESLRKAKARLKKKGFIHFENEPGKPTKYRLVKLYADTPQTPPQSPPQTLSEIPNNACAIDVKTLRQNQSIACEKVEELDALLDYWERDLHGGRLSFEHQSKLSALLKERGAAWLKAAMKDAADENNNPRGISPKFLFSVIARKAKPAESAPKKITPLNDYEALRQKLLGGD